MSAVISFDSRSTFLAMVKTGWGGESEAMEREIASRVLRAVMPRVWREFDRRLSSRYAETVLREIVGTAAHVMTMTDDIARLGEASRRIADLALELWREFDN